MLKVEDLVSLDDIWPRSWKIKAWQSPWYLEKLGLHESPGWVCAVIACAHDGSSSCTDGMYMCTCASISNLYMMCLCLCAVLEMLSDILTCFYCQFVIYKVLISYSATAYINTVKNNASSKMLSSAINLILLFYLSDLAI